MTVFSIVPASSRWTVAGAVVVALAVLAFIVLGGARSGKMTTMTRSDSVAAPSIPPIDAAAPAITETATFALG